MDFDQFTKLAKIRINKKFKEVFSGPSFEENLKKTIKEDKSPVTILDQFISDELKMVLRPKLEKGYCFYSEEDHNQLTWPAIILDPIDGTKELARGIGECTVSLAILKSPKEQEFCWLYNPFTGHELSTIQEFCSPVDCFEGQLSGLVSRSEWKKGLYDNYDNENITLVPRGSIANKLGLLASGACDFVVSRRPKGLWDIAAGTFLLWQRGFKLFVGNQELSSLEELNYEEPLIWCRSSKDKQIVFNSLGL